MPQTETKAGVAANLHYKGSFLGNNGMEWEVRIYEQGYAGSIGELTFPAEEPLIIEWEHKDKHEPISGSTATLTIESPGDRTYIDLYTVEAGRIWMDVLKDNRLFWRGSLDSEFYEEPYSTDKHYDVKFSFSDFGILQRINFNGNNNVNYNGSDSIRSLIQQAMGACRLTDGIRYIENISTEWEDGRQLYLDELYVLRSNWTDEYGEVATLEDVLAGILQPLGLKIVQRGGCIIVTDLNYLYEDWAAEAIRWSDTDQRLGTDRVYNNAKITLSPYGNGKAGFQEIAMKQGAFDWDAWKPFNEMFMFADGSSTEKGYTSYYSQMVGEQHEIEDPEKGFSIFWDKEGSGVTLGSGRYCYIHAFESGQNAHCIAEIISDYDCLSMTPTYASFGYVRPTDGGKPQVLFETRARIEAGVKGQHWWRLTLEALADIRYNPFASGDKTDEWFSYHIKERACWMFIPVEITFAGDDGRIQTYRNADIIFGERSMEEASSRQCGTWTMNGGIIDSSTIYAPGADERYWHFDAYLCYYNKEDRAHDTGIGGGWKKNTASIGRTLDGLGRAWKGRGDGEFLPLPTDEQGRPIGGEVRIRVMSGALIYDDMDTVPKNRYNYIWRADGTRVIAGQDNFSDSVRAYMDDEQLLAGIMNQPFPLHWLLFKQADMELVSRRTWEVPDQDDVEYSGIINVNAREDIEIDTVCGTLTNTRPMARGVLRKSSGEQVHRLKRGSRTDTAEQLLIGTLFSQYGSRKTVLTGTAEMPSTAYQTYTDSAMENKLFLLTAETLDCIAEESLVELTELGKEEYSS